MIKKISGKLMLLLITVSLLASLPQMVRADEVYTYFDSATDGTETYVFLPPSEAQAEAYAEPSGLIRARVRARMPTKIIHDQDINDCQFINQMKPEFGLSKDF